MKKVLNIINNIIYIIINIFFVVLIDEFDIYIENYTLINKLKEIIFGAYPIIYILPVGIFMIFKIIQVIKRKDIIFDKKYNIILLLFNLSFIPATIEYFFNTGFSILSNFYLYVFFVNILIILYNLLSIKTIKKESE